MDPTLLNPKKPEPDLIPIENQMDIKFNSKYPKMFSIYVKFNLLIFRIGFPDATEPNSYQNSKNTRIYPKPLVPKYF